MISEPSFADVLDGLGEKVIAALAHSVSAARADLAEYRDGHSGWVADHTERGLANWIHDRLWAHLLRGLDDVPGVHIDPGEPIREIVVGIRYRLRVKRHDEVGQLAAIETQTMLQFFVQGVQPAFPNMEELRLFAGYVWDRESRAMGPAVLSLRDGRDAMVWQEELPELAGGGSSAIPISAPDGPTVPQIEVEGIDGRESDRDRR